MDQKAAHQRLIESFWPISLRLALASGQTFGFSRSADSVLLWLDIVGSTRIASQLIKSGRAGIEQLSKLLNQHFDSLLKMIVAHGGRPIMFAGDGLLSGWTCSDCEPREAALRAAQCAEEALAAPIPVGSDPSVRLHAVLAFGSCQTVEIEATDRIVFVTVGTALRDLQRASRNRAAGRLILSPGVEKIIAEDGEILDAPEGGRILNALCHHIKPAPLSVPPLSESMLPCLARHLPHEITISSESDQMAWAAELRRVAAVFVALPGIDCAKPDVIERLEKVVHLLMPLLRRYDGVFHEMCVDDKSANLIVLFGAPPASHANDSALAVRMAIDLRDTLGREGYRSSIGIATANALCGLIGNDIFRRHMVFGDAINLASRLKELGEGEIQCDQTTAHGARGEVGFVPLGYEQIEGIPGPSQVFSPRRQDKPEPSIPMHGRQSELSKLMSAVQASLASKTRHALLIEGETGIGKSRLLAEFLKSLTARAVRVLTANADRIGSHTPFHCWKQVFAQLLDVGGLSEPDAKTKILDRLGNKSALLTAVLTIKFPDPERLLSLPKKQVTSLRADLLLSLLQAAAREKTLCIVIDDAHWLDDASWDFACKAAAEVQGLCMIVATQPLGDDLHRENFIGAGAKPLLLQTLDDSERDGLIRARLGVENVAKEVSSLIADRAQGHPYFCIELTRSLLEDGTIEVGNGRCWLAAHVRPANLRLPDTVQGAVTRRIDRLEEGPKIALKVASIAGLRFPISLLRDVYPIAQERSHLEDYLSLHQRLGFFSPEKIDEQDGYAFRHGIIRDVAYELVPLEQRAQLHLRIAGWYESIHAEDLPRHYSLLAHHLEMGGKPLRAAQYLMNEAGRLFGLGLAGQSVPVGLQAAGLLGVVLPTDLESIGRQLGEEQARIDDLLGDRNPQDLLCLTVSPAQEIDAVLEMLVTIGPLAFQSRQVELYALVITTALRIQLEHALEHGNGPKAAEVYSMYSVIVGGFSYSRLKKAAWSQLALDLLEAHRDERFGRVAFVHTWFHNHWVGPIDASIRLSREAAASAISKDVMFGCFNLAACIIYLAAAGRPLADVIQQARHHLAEIGDRVVNAAFHVKLELQSAKALASLTDGPLSLSDEEFDEEKDIGWICDTELENQIGYYLVTRAKLHTHFGDWQGAQKWIEKVQEPRSESGKESTAAKESTILRSIKGQIAEVELIQFSGLAALAEAAFGVNTHSGNLPKGRSCVAKLASWEDQAPAASMFGHKRALLEGVLEFCGGSTQKACSTLAQAGRAAASKGFLNDSVLAFEFLARCCRKSGRHEEAVSALNEAIQMCDRWGANAKLSFLKKEFADVDPLLVRPSNSCFPATQHERAYQGRAQEAVSKGSKPF